MLVLLDVKDDSEDRAFVTAQDRMLFPLVQLPKLRLRNDGSESSDGLIATQIPRKREGKLARCPCVLRLLREEVTVFVGNYMLECLYDAVFIKQIEHALIRRWGCLE